MPDPVRILIRKGVYEERVTIGKPLELVGERDRYGGVEIRASSASAFGERASVIFNALQGRLAWLSIRNLCVGDGLLVKKGRPEVEDCNVSSGDARCITVSSYMAKPHIHRCRIHHGRMGGVYVMNHAAGLIEDCDIVDNGLTGIVVDHGGAPTVRKCRINRNRGWAVSVNEHNGGGVYEDNDLRDNAKGAWNIAPESLERVTRQRNIEE